MSTTNTNTTTTTTMTDLFAPTAPAPTNNSSAPPPQLTNTMAPLTPPTEVVPTGSQELDLAFCCDCTGSMGSYIRSAQDNIRRIAEEIHQRIGKTASVRFALVKYRDHPPQDKTFVTEVFPFTENLQLMKKNVDTMAAQGGGDGPEAVTAALHEVNSLPWRPNATKVVVLISDAPPHGLGEDGDGFPNGCPMGYDPIKICKEMASRSIVIYAVGVEPILSSSYKFARDFMIMISTITEGKFLPLGKASILAEVVVSGAVEGVSMKALWEKLEAEVEAEAKANGVKLDLEKKVHATEARLVSAAPKVSMAQVEVVNPYLDDHYDMHNCNAMQASESLSEARQRLDANRNAHVAQQSRSYEWAKQEAFCAPSAPMQPQQCMRMGAQAKKSAGMWSYK